MTAPTPETIGPQLQDQINRWIVNAERYLRNGDEPMLVKRWERDVEALEKHSAAAASLFRARLAEARGDLPQVLYWVGNALKLHAPHDDTVEACLVACSNLCCASEGLKWVRGHVDIKYGNIARSLRLMCSLGAFSELKRLFDQAERGGVDLTNAAMPANVTEIAALISEAGVSDDECAAVIDVAGDVLRMHSLFWLGMQPEFLLDDEDQSLLIRYQVAVTPNEATTMTMEAINKLIERDLDRTAVMIGFVGMR